jgi:putative transposase
MSDNSDHPNRRKPSDGDYYLDRGYIVFVTVCTRQRRPWLADPKIHALLRETWEQASAWLVGRYVILTDHVHLFASPGDGGIEIEPWMTYWKSRFAMKNLDNTCKWQSRAWHSRLRTGESYSAKWNYVRNNPVRHGLVLRAEDWPYQGEISELSWG